MNKITNKITLSKNKNGVVFTNNDIDTNKNAFDIASMSNELNDIVETLQDRMTTQQLNVIRQQIMYNAFIQENVNDVNKERKLLKININNEFKRFLQQYKSYATAKTYECQIQRFFAYCDKHNINTLRANRKHAEMFVETLKQQNIAMRSLHLCVRACSAFYAYLSLHHNDILTNIFYKIKLPKIISSKTIDVLTFDDLTTILNETKKNVALSTFILIIATHGFRSGAFEKMFINKNNRYTTITKNKQQTGYFDKRIMSYIKRAFGPITCEKLIYDNVKTRSMQSLFLYYTKKLYAKKMIAHAYSFHDLRHFYAVNVYNNNHDIYALSKSLNHANIAITGHYLTTLNIDFNNDIDNDIDNDNNNVKNVVDVTQSVSMFDTLFAK